MRAVNTIAILLGAVAIAHAAEITGFYLADAVTDETLLDGPLEAGVTTTINLSELPTNRLTVYALASDDTTGVRMRLNGNNHYERESPYALFGDNPDYHFPDDQFLGLGRNSIQATAYASENFRTATDTKGLTLRIIAGDGRPCTFDVEVSSCDLETIAAEIDTDACNIYQYATTVEMTCARARAEADAGKPLSELIPEFDEQDIDNYFNGGTYWNENTGDLDAEAPIIEQLYEEYAQSATIAFPSSSQNFGECDTPAVMCVWVRDRQAGDNNGNCATPLDQRCTDADPADNTDLCYVDASRAPVSAHVPVGYASFPGESEGDIHAHGFAWGPGSQSSRFKGNLLFYISMYDHLSQRGYAENVPLAPMCGCADRMPTISRADCTEVDVDEVYRVKMDGGRDTLSAERTSVAIDFNACDGATNNDLYSEVAQLYADDGEVLDAIRDFLVGPENNNDPSNCPE